MPTSALATIPLAGQAGLVTACLAGLASAASWALASILVERVLRRGASAPSAAAINLFKNVLAAAAFGAVWLAQGADVPGGRAVGLMLVSGVLGFAFSDSLYFAALPRCGVQAAAMVYILTVPLAALLSLLLLGERLGAATLGSMGVVLAGVVLVLFDPPVAPRGATGDARAGARRAGIGLALAAAVCQALGVVAGRDGLRGVDVITGTVGRLAGGVAGALVLASLLGALRGGGARAACLELVSPLGRRSAWRALFPAALFGSLLTLPLYTMALRDAPAGVSTLLFTTTPLFTLPIGRLFGMRLGWRAVLGTAVGFLGVWGVVMTMA